MGFFQSLDDELAKIRSFGKSPPLMLHCCCAPCASHVLELLAPAFDTTIMFYNPNIQPRQEHDKRAGEFQKILGLDEYRNCVGMIISDSDSDRDVFCSIASMYPEEPEGGRRCKACFELRLTETAKRARKDGYEYFATALSVSPHKNAVVINEIGSSLAEEFGVKYLAADFKKRDGYKRSVELSKKYGLYRQSYCGCERSRAVRSSRLGEDL